jgi:hypothetical protein
MGLTRFSASVVDLLTLLIQGSYDILMPACDAPGSLKIFHSGPLGLLVNCLTVAARGVYCLEAAPLQLLTVANVLR